MQEEESWGILTKEEFEGFLKEFSRRYGKPTQSRRLSFSFWDHTRNEVDTRIRITNGKAEIMQKVGNWEMNPKWSRSEHSISITPKVDEVVDAYGILRLLIPGKKACYIAQFENYIFDNPDFEIKLTHQFGKSDKYNFEIELKSEKCDLEKLLSDLGLVKLVRLTDEQFWNKWNEEVNLSDEDLTRVKLEELIQKYL